MVRLYYYFGRALTPRLSQSVQLLCGEHSKRVIFLKSYLFLLGIRSISLLTT